MKRKREMLKKCTKHVASIYEQKDPVIVFQNRLALSTQDKLRMQQSFETHEDAIQQTSITRKQSHTPHPVRSRRGIRKMLKEPQRLASGYRFAKAIGIDTKGIGWNGGR